MMGIGSDRSVNAVRVLFFFADTVCVYPAQSFDEFKYTDTNPWTQAEFWTDDYEPSGTSDTSKGYFIERNAENYFRGGGNDDAKFVTFYSPIDPENPQTAR